MPVVCHAPWQALETVARRGNNTSNLMGETGVNPTSKHTIISSDKELQAKRIGHSREYYLSGLLGVGRDWSLGESGGASQRK